MTDRVTEAVAELLDALHRARKLTAEADADRPAMITGATVAASSPPWNPHVAATLYSVTEAARRLEAETRAQVADSTLQRGGSDGNTDAAIEALAKLTAAIPARDAQEVTRLLTRWTTSLLRLPAIDEAVIWLPIRTQTLCPDDGTQLVFGACPGCGFKARPPRCPYCQTANLRRADRAFVVMCFYPGCQDADGNQPPFARLDISRLTGHAILAWADGLVEGG